MEERKQVKPQDPQKPVIPDNMTDLTLAWLNGEMPYETYRAYELAIQERDKKPPTIL